MRPTAVRTLNPGQGPTVSMVGDTYTILAGSAQTNGAYAIIDMLIPPGGGPGPHAHADIQESFYVVAGEVVVRSETQVYTAGPGSFVEIARGGAVHSFHNESQQPAHLLCLVVPAGLDQFFLEVGQPVAPGQVLPPAHPTPEQLQTLQAAATKYGQELFPPDYLTHR